MTGTDYWAFDLMSCNMFYVDSVSYKIFIETIGPFSTKLLVIPDSLTMDQDDFILGGAYATGNPSNWSKCSATINLINAIYM